MSCSVVQPTKTEKSRKNSIGIVNCAVHKKQNHIHKLGYLTCPKNEKKTATSRLHALLYRIAYRIPHTESD